MHQRHNNIAHSHPSAIIPTLREELSYMNAPLAPSTISASCNKS